MSSCSPVIVPVIRTVIGKSHVALVSSGLS
jgi:hypothetical protein